MPLVREPQVSAPRKATRASATPANAPSAPYSASFTGHLWGASDAAYAVCPVSRRRQTGEPEFKRPPWPPS
ncbi:hypothetical protein NDU88_001023 [Pleurodeles waltl]|uniref:Uncharacterized protein n=1 Tax=Pleurodeles waltl TaxID=8319 RepID=A0AAV7Q4S4_PLEWA|nr:hypothetical protein NDU88_001023 [Pleurodeles waltl]